MVGNVLSKEEVYFLAQKHSRWVQRRLRLTAEDGEDLASEVFLAIGDSPLYRNGKPDAFVIRVLLNRGISLIKSKKHQEQQLPEHYDDVDESDDLWEEVFGEIVSDEIKKLPVEDRLVLTAAYEKIPNDVVARILGCHPNTVIAKKNRLKEKYKWIFRD